MFPESRLKNPAFASARFAQCASLRLFPCLRASLLPSPPRIHNLLRLSAHRSRKTQSHHRSGLRRPRRHGTCRPSLPSCNRRTQKSSASPWSPVTLGATKKSYTFCACSKSSAARTFPSFPAPPSLSSTARNSSRAGRRSTAKSLTRAPGISPNGTAVHGPAEVPPMPEDAPTTKASHRKRRAIPAAHGPQISARGHHLRRRPADESRYRPSRRPCNLRRSPRNSSSWAAASNPRHDPEFTMTPRREFNLWMDPEVFADRPARALAAHRGHHRGYFL